MTPPFTGKQKLTCPWPEGPDGRGGSRTQASYSPRARKHGRGAHKLVLSQRLTLMKWACTQRRENGPTAPVAPTLPAAWFST